MAPRLICPYCERAFAYTWRRYFRGRRRPLRCPHCSHDSEFVLETRYMLVSLASAAALASSPLLILAAVSRIPAYLPWVAVAVTLGLPPLWAIVDRRLDAALGRLRGRHDTCGPRASSLRRERAAARVDPTNPYAAVVLDEPSGDGVER